MFTLEFYFILLLNIRTILTDYITYPLVKIKNNPKNDEITSYIYSELFDTHYLIKMDLPNNHQVDCSIDMVDINLQINETVNNYYLNSSSTFEKVSETYSDIFPLTAINSEDISSTKKERLNFSLINSNNQTCKLGFGNPSNTDDVSKNLLSQFKKLNLTNLYYFTFNYNKNFVRFGDLPEFTNSEKYKKEDFHHTNSATDIFKYNFNLLFSKIIFMNKTNNETKELTSYLRAKIDFGFNYMIGPENFKEIIKAELSKNYTVWKEENITYQNENYSIFYCENKDKLKENFPSISFYHSELETNFTFNSDDLFTEIKSGKYLFNVIFPVKKSLYWYLGGIFTRKYQLFLNIDNNNITYCSNNYDNDEKNKDNESKNDYFALKITLIIVLVVIILIIGFILVRRIYLKKRKNSEDLDYNKIDTPHDMNINV